VHRDQGALDTGKRRPRNPHLGIRTRIRLLAHAAALPSTALTLPSNKAITSDE